MFVIMISIMISALELLADLIFRGGADRLEPSY